MNCREAASLLSLYLDHELDDLRRKRVELHLQKCPACSHDLATLAKTVRLVRAAAELGQEGDRSGVSAATVKTKAQRRRRHE